MAAAGLALAVPLLLSLPGPAAAQSLASIPGQTSLQQRTGLAIATVCTPLAAAGTNRNGPSATEDLFGRCQDLVQTGNDVVGAGATTFSLGLTADQTNQALEAVTSEEVASQGTNTTDIQAQQSQAIGGRMAALRGGASGLSVAGLQIRSPSGFGTMSLANALPPSLSNSLANGLTAGQDSGEAWYMGRLSAFVSGTIGTGDSDASSEEAGFDFDLWGLTAGVDYRVTDSFVVGAAFSYHRNDSDFDDNGGEMDTRAYGLTVYGTGSITDEIWYEGSLGYTRDKFEMDRNISYATINRVASGETDGNEYSGSAGLGYDYSHGAFTATPTVKVAYLRTDIDGFTESGAAGLNLAIDDQDVRSLTSQVGLDLTYAISTDFGVLVPGARVAWIHEFDDDSRVISLRYTADPNATTFSVITNDPDRNYAEAGLSLVAILPGGNSLFLDYATLLAHDSTNAHTLTGGLRIEF